jgi:hypothetical protein
MGSSRRSDCIIQRSPVSFQLASIISSSFAVRLLESFSTLLPTWCHNTTNHSNLSQSRVSSLTNDATHDTHLVLLFIAAIPTIPDQCTALLCPSAPAVKTNTTHILRYSPLTRAHVSLCTRSLLPLMIRKRRTPYCPRLISALNSTT